MSDTEITTSFFRSEARSSVEFDGDAGALLDRRPELRAVVREAIEQMQNAFENAEIVVEYLADPDDDDPVEQIYVVAYTSRSDRLARLRRVNRTWWRNHAQYGTLPLTLSAHGV